MYSADSFPDLLSKVGQRVRGSGTDSQIFCCVLLSKFFFFFFFFFLFSFRSFFLFCTAGFLVCFGLTCFLFLLFKFLVFFVEHLCLFCFLIFFGFFFKKKFFFALFLLQSVRNGERAENEDCGAGSPC